MIYQVSTQEIIIGNVVFVILFSLLQWLLSLWIKARLENSIKHEYSIRLEEFKFDQLRRLKAETIAVFFAKWIKYRGNEAEMLEKNNLLDYYEELNKMSFELTMWIDDEKLLREIMKRFNNSPEALEVRDLLIETRKYLAKKPDNNFQSHEIIVWPTDKLAKEKKIFEK